jgi:hypothetical protein
MTGLAGPAIITGPAPVHSHSLIEAAVSIQGIRYGDVLFLTHSHYRGPRANNCHPFPDYIMTERKNIVFFMAYLSFSLYPIKDAMNRESYLEP